MRQKNDQAKENDKGEYVETGGKLIPTEITLEVPAPARVIGDARSFNRNATDGSIESTATPVQKYRVLSSPPTVSCKRSGHRVRLHPGKEIDKSNYDIIDLQKQGVRLEKIDAAVAPEVFVE